MTDSRASQVSESSGSQLPPIAQVAVISMALVIASGIYLASHLPKTAPLGPVVALLAVAGFLLLLNVALLGRLRHFAWPVFFRVAGWAGIAYVVIAGMLEFIFVFDHTRGSMLVVLTLSLLIFALNIPLLLAFSVARYQEVEGISTS